MRGCACARPGCWLTLRDETLEAVQLLGYRSLTEQAQYVPVVLLQLSRGSELAAARRVRSPRVQLRPHLRVVHELGVCKHQLAHAAAEA